MAISKSFKFSLILGLISLTTGCQAQQSNVVESDVQTGAEQMDKYLHVLEDKNVALLVNHTSVVNGVHLLDTLLARGIQVKKVFAPEHGFRGNKANGEQVKDDKDIKTGLPIISLYGSNKKPTKEHLDGIDVVIYDIQDVGARFYTYISAMHYMMAACVENGVSIMVFDRPNPNGHYVDGPVLDMQYQSYVGMHKIPIVYGMTCGEMANMIVGENWISSADRLDLTVIPVNNWNHKMPYSLPISPSPNLPNDQSILLYPSLCLFEGTQVSVGRGTPDPFQILGVPDSAVGNYLFTPVSIPGASKYPKHENKLCYGLDLRSIDPANELDLSYLIQFYQQAADKSDFFNKFFVKLAGTDQLQKQIEAGLSEKEIKDSWQPELDRFKAKRKKYLLYD